MLFYAKTSNDYFFRQTLTAPELWPHLIKIQEALLLNNPNNMKIRSSTGIRESLRIQNFNSLENNKKSIESNKKSIDRAMENFEKHKKPRFQNNRSISPISKSSEGVLKKSTNFVNNYIANNEMNNNEGNRSQKILPNQEEDESFFDRIDNLADTKLKVLGKRKKEPIISIIEEEKGNESLNQQSESMVLKGRQHVEFIYKEEENAGHLKKIEIVKI